MAYLGGTEMYTGFSWGSLNERYFLEELGVDRWIGSSRNMVGERRGAWTEYLVFDTEKWSAAVNSVVSESFKT